jgi:hypothetical protein
MIIGLFARTEMAGDPYVRTEMARESENEAEEESAGLVGCHRAQWAVLEVLM